MIGSIVLALALAQTPPTASQGCEPEAPVRDPSVCEPIYQDGRVKIYTMESVAVGSIDEMRNVRQMTSHCDVSNRIDHLGGVDLGVYDIVNADKKSRACVVDWIKENARDLEFSEDRLTQRFRYAPMLNDEDAEASR